MIVKPIKTLSFPERISIFNSSDRHEQFMVNGKKNRYYLLDINFEIKYRFETPYDRSELSVIHPAEPLAAIMGKDNVLHVAGFDGAEIWSKPGEYIAACWSLDGTWLYTLLRMDSNTLKLMVYDNAGLEIAGAVFADALYESAAFLSTIPNNAEMLMQLMAGQDGCSLVFVGLNDDKQLFMRPMRDKYSYICAAFNQSGTHFLCIENDERAIYRFTYPELQQIGMRKFTADDGCLDYTLIHLGNKAVIRYKEVFYLMDLADMEKLDDLTIEGHEPVPTCQVYPSLTNDIDPFCDVLYLCVAGAHILGVTDNNELIVLKIAEFMDGTMGSRPVMMG